MNQLPAVSGIGLKAQHYQALINNPRATGWLEIHPENYMGDGGPPHRYLAELNTLYPLSMHGVGMSLGASEGVDDAHLLKLKKLVDRYNPASISEHLSWSHWNRVFLNDLLPLPYTNESLETICRNIDKVQSTLGRTILIENPSTYIDFKQSDYSEPDFFKEITRRCDCKILLDINNVFVSGFNNHFDPYKYLEQFPAEQVEEIHLAGHSIQSLSNNTQIRIDDHGSEVRKEVWKLYEYFFAREKRAIATLIEWDTDIPELDILLNETRKADEIMNRALTGTGEVSA